MIIKCTKKLLQQLGKSIVLSTDSSNSDSKLGDWYANLLYIERKKCLLFTNEKTLFSFFMPCVNKEGLNILPRLFTNNLKLVLHEEGIDDNIINEIISDFGEIRYGKTSNRSVLGSMIDIAFQYKVSISMDGGLLCCNFPETIRRINRIPMSGIDYAYAIEKLKKIFDIPYEKKVYQQKDKN